MFLAKRIIAAFLLILLVGGHARAFWNDGTCSSGHSTSAQASPYATTLPTGGSNTNDVLVEFVSCSNCTDFSVSAGWTIFAITGGDGANNAVWNTTGKFIVAWALQGAAALSVSYTTNSAFISYVSCRFYGVDNTTPITAATFQLTTTSLTATIPTVGTPGFANEEELIVGSGMWGTNAVQSSVGTQTTCGTLTIQNPEPGQAGESAQPPEVLLNQINQGPCAPSATSSTTLVMTGSAGNNIGVGVLLKSAAIPPALRHFPLNVAIDKSNLVRINSGDWGITPDDRNLVTWDVPTAGPVSQGGLPWIDGITGGFYAVNMNQAEPNCVSPMQYLWDDADNRILNARIAGLYINPSLAAGFTNQCGTTTFGAPLCTSANYVQDSESPSWIYTSNSCNGNSAVPYIFTPAGVGGLTGSLAQLPDIGDNGNSTVGFEFAVDAYITAVSTRYCIPSGGHCTGPINNISAVPDIGLSNNSDELTYNNGSDGTTTTCQQGSGNTADCAQMSGDSDYPGGTPALGKVIFPLTNNTQDRQFMATVSGATSAQPNWDSSCATSCTDGSATWYSPDAQWLTNVQDSAQWGTLPVWASTHAYTIGQMIQDSLGNQEVALVSGTSGSSAPGWANVLNGRTVDHVVSGCQPSCGLVWQEIRVGFTGAGLTQANNLCTTVGGLCRELLLGQEHIETTLNSKFPGMVIKVQGYSGGLLSNSEWIGGAAAQECGSLTAKDPLTAALQAWHTSSGFPFQEQNNAYGQQAFSNGVFNDSPNLPYCKQPIKGVAYQTKLGETTAVSPKYAANSGTLPDWQVTHAYSSGNQICPLVGNAGNLAFTVTIAGTSGGSPPTWDQSMSTNNTFMDGGVTWAFAQYFCPGYFSISGTNFIPNLVYQALQRTSPARIEIHAGDQTAASNFWLKLLHDSVWNP